MESGIVDESALDGVSRSGPTGLADDSTAASSPAQSNRTSLTVWERLSFAVTYAAVSGLLACLSLSRLYKVGRWFGTIEWLINYKRRRRFTDALRSVLGHEPTPAQRRRWGRDFFIRNRCDRLFFLIFDRIPRHQVLALFTIGDQPLLDEAFARGRGVYIAMSHHGPQQVAAMLMAMRGYKVAGVRDRREGRMRRYVRQRYDRRHPEFRRVRMLYADSYPREIYRCFRDGFVLGSAMDVGRVRTAHQKTVTVTIFGEQRPFVSGPLRIALRCRAPVLQGFIIPRSGFRYHLELTGLVLEPGEAEDEKAVVLAALRTYAANIERQVRGSPSLMSRI